MTEFLIFWGLLNFILFWLSLSQVRNSGKKVVFIYLWAFPLGAFIWEDLLVFSLFHLLVVFFIAWTRDLRLGLLIFIIFWIIRTSGEILYWFLQQFNQPTSYPHNQYQGFKILKRFLGEISNQKCFIILQVAWQVLLTAFVLALVCLLRNWTNIDAWF